MNNPPNCPSSSMAANQLPLRFPKMQKPRRRIIYLLLVVEAGKRKNIKPNKPLEVRRQRRGTRPIHPQQRPTNNTPSTTLYNMKKQVQKAAPAKKRRPPEYPEGSSSDRRTKFSEALDLLVQAAKTITTITDHTQRPALAAAQDHERREDPSMQGICDNRRLPKKRPSGKGPRPKATKDGP